MAHEVSFRVVGGVSQWAFEHAEGYPRVFVSNVDHTAEFGDDELKYLEAAHAAGYIEYTGDTVAIEGGHVESQEDSEAAYAAAVESGAWHEGNLEQYEIDVAAGARKRQEDFLALPELVEEDQV